jgi:hypothetical protein
MTMNTGLHRIEWAGLAGLARLAILGGGFPGQPEKTAARTLAAKTLRTAFVWLPAALIVGFGGWMLLSAYSSKPAESEPVHLTTAAVPELAPSPVTDSAPDGSLPNTVPAPVEATAPAEMSPVDGLKISSQSWRRGGLGSKALVTFTLRNGNDYAVRDIEISCAFTRRDGSHLTDRRRIIRETVNTRSRKTITRMHVGFVNVNADRARCSPVTASRI